MKSLLAFFLFLALSLTSFSQGKFEAKLSIDKKIYKKQEVISLDLNFKNNDTADISINYNCSLKYDIMIGLEFKNQNNFVYKLWPGSTIDCFGEKVTIKPGKAYYVNNIKIVLSKLLYFKNTYYLPVGEYSLTSTFAAISNSVTFKVVEK